MVKPRFTLYKHIKIGRGDTAVPPLRSTTRSNRISSLLVERRRSTRTAPTVSAIKISGSR